MHRIDCVQLEALWHDDNVEVADGADRHPDMIDKSHGTAAAMNVFH